MTQRGQSAAALPADLLRKIHWLRHSATLGASSYGFLHHPWRCRGPLWA